MRRCLRVAVVWAVAVLMVIDSAAACRLLAGWRCRRACDPCCPPPSCGSSAPPKDNHPEPKKEQAELPAKEEPKPAAKDDVKPATKDEPIDEPPAKKEEPAAKKDEPAAKPVPKAKDDLQDLFDEPKSKPKEAKKIEEKPAEADLFDEPAAKEKPSAKTEKTMEEDLLDEPAAKAKPAAKPEKAKEPDLFDEPAGKEKPADEPETKKAPDKTAPKDDLDGLFNDPAEKPQPKPADQGAQDDADANVDDLFDTPPATPKPGEILARPVALEKPKPILAKLPLAIEAAPRSWLDNTGQHGCHGRLAEIQDGKIRIFKDNGKYSTVPLERLSEGDREYVDRQAKEAGLVLKVTAVR